MTLLQVIVLAVVQGITEFLPISSSGHLILVPALTDWPDQGLAMDVAVHVGTLGAVLLYFWRDVWAMTMGFVMTFSGRRDPRKKLFWFIVAATIPVVLAGFALKTWGHMEALRSIVVIGWAMLGFGIVLWVVDRLCMTVRRIDHMSFLDTVLIGLSQCLALIPGTSRAGITMTMARFLGFERAEAARFSMLLSIPTIVAAGALEGYELYTLGDPILTEAALIGAGLAFVSALLAIAVLMAWLKRSTFTPFVLYRLVLGVFLLAVGYEVISLP